MVKKYNPEYENLQRYILFKESKGSKHKTSPVDEVKIVMPKSSNVRLKTTPKGTSLPHPLKCSKCDYIASSINDSKQHWLDH